MPAGDIYESVANAPAVPDGLPLVVLLTGFTDAGETVAGAIEYAGEELDPTPLAVFDNDALLDFRARRPGVTFDRDHLSDYRAPRLELSLVHDALGQPFLLLAGYEPDFAWEAVVSAILALASRYRVKTVTWTHAIAMPVPHTRSIGTTVSGSREELLSHSVWKPQTRVPATIGHLLEVRLVEAQVPVTGLVMLVPHYLAETDYPGATIAALDKIMTSTGLVFSVDELRERDHEYLGKVAEQIAGNEELSRMLHGLEERHDAYMAGLSGGTDGLDAVELPSADELAAELERFLASRPDDDRRGGSGPALE